MKSIIILFFLLPFSNIFGQITLDSIFQEKIYDRSSLTHVSTPDSISFPFFEVDTLAKTPVTGWVRSFIENEYISFEHYESGLSNGFFVNYKFLNDKYRLVSYGDSYKGWTNESYDYKLKKDSIYFSKGFVRFWTDNYHLRRTIKVNSRRIRIIDDYYFYSSKKNKKVKYKIDSLNQTELGQYYWMSFPLMLNENLNPSTFLRFDGHYVHHIYHQEEKYCVSQFVKFYSDGRVKIIYKTGITDRFEDWNQADVLEGDYFLEGNSFSFKVNSVEFKEGVLVTNFSFLSLVRSSSNEPFRRYHYTFISD